MTMDYETVMRWSVFALKRTQRIDKANADAMAQARAQAARDQEE